MNQAVNLLTRAAILAAEDIQFTDVECPEWGGVVRVRNLTAEARGEFIKQSMEIRNAKGKNKDAIDYDVETKLVAMTAIDADGARIFSDDDVKLLAKKSSAPLVRCAKAAQKLSGLQPDAADEAGKDFEETQS